MLLVTTLGLVLTTILVAKLGNWTRLNAADLGSMSHQWVAAHQASQHASSM
jgi:hypothetical protein